MISSARIDPWIQWFWQSTGDVQLLRELLEWEIQDRPDIRRALERVLEIENNLVTGSRIARAIAPYEYAIEIVEPKIEAPKLNIKEEIQTLVDTNNMNVN